MCSHEPLASFGAAEKGHATRPDETSLSLLPGTFISTNRSLGLGIIATAPNNVVAPLSVLNIEVPQTGCTPGSVLLAADRHKGAIRVLRVKVTHAEAHHLRFVVCAGEEALSGEGAHQGLPLMKPDTLEVVAMRLKELGSASLVDVFLDKLHRRKQLGTALDLSLAPKPAKKKKVKEGSTTAAARILEAAEELTTPNVQQVASAANSTPNLDPARTMKSTAPSAVETLLDSNSVFVAVLVLFVAMGLYVAGLLSSTSGVEGQ